MKVLLKSLGIVLLAAIGAGAVLFWYGQSERNSEKMRVEIYAAITKYVENNSQIILENLARNENFGNTIRNFTTTNDELLKARIKNVMTDNRELLEGIIEDNASMIAEAMLRTESFKNLGKGEQNASYENGETNTDENKIYKDHWDEIINNDVSPAIGPKDAKVTVVEFFDFACGHCKSLAPVMSKLVKNNPDVRFIFNPLYFISEHSPYAAKVALAAHEKGKFAEVFDGIMTLPQISEEAINQILTDEGLDVAEIKKMIEEKKIRRGTQDIDALSQVLGINGVPMLLINGEAFYGRTLEDLQNRLNSYK